MRKIKDLLAENERVWFYVTDEWQKEFYEELLFMGVKFRNGNTITQESISYLMGVGRDGTVGYVSHFSWYYSFISKYATYQKIDYGRFHCGEEDYLILEPNIKPVIWDDVEVID